MSLEDVAQVAQIILLDIVLSGDNAVVIAMAAHKLPAYQRRRAILWGGAIAIVLRIVFTMIMSVLLTVPLLRLIGGAVLVWIACKLLLEEEEHAVTPDNADRSAMAAIRMIFIADFMMSLDNMLAVAGASHGDWKKLLLGLFVSIGIIMTCSSLIARLMNRFQWIVYLGAAILAYTAGDMMIGDREVARYIVQNHRVCLNGHWESEFLRTDVKVAKWDRPDDLPAELRDRVRHSGGVLRVFGQITESERDLLLAHVESKHDREAIEHELYDVARVYPVPGWVPEGLRARVDPWFQLKFPYALWQGLEGRHHHWVAWVFFGVVIVFCMSTPYWLGGKKPHEPPPAAGP